MNLAEALGVVTPEEVAPVLGCTTKTVEDDLRAGLLPGWKTGRGWRLSVDALRQHFAAAAIKNLPPAAPGTLRAPPGRRA